MISREVKHSGQLYYVKQLKEECIETLLKEECIETCIEPFLGARPFARALENKKNKIR